MVQFNYDKVCKVSSEILSSLALLDELASEQENEFANDLHKVSSAKYNLIVVIEGAIDLCNHIISMNGWKTPDDYADTFNIMADHGAFDELFLMSLVKMSRFRNRLVHIYWDVSVKDIYSIIKSDIKEIKIFLEKFYSFTECNVAGI